MIKLVFIIFNLMGIMAYHLNYDEVTVSQEIPERINSGESFTVELEINKGNHEGFAKWQQELPKGFKAEMMETRGGTFSFKNQILKLIWLELPEEENFTITYRVVTDPELTNKSFDLAGKYSYISENDRVDVFSENETITIAEPAEITAYSEKTNLKAEELEETKHEDKSDIIIDFDSPEHQEPISKKKISKTSTTDNTPTSFEYRKVKQDKVNISYKVQIAAGHGELKKNYFIDYFQMDDYVSTESHNGWNKYTIGYFSDYGAARNKRNALWAKHRQTEGAFVTAYLEGNRISVQEALKISEEQWIK